MYLTPVPPDPDPRGPLGLLALPALVVGTLALSALLGAALVVRAGVEMARTILRRNPMPDDDVISKERTACDRCLRRYELSETYDFGGRTVCIDCAQDGIDELAEALDQSVKLQTHYAALLNQYDGGERRGFPTVAGWVARLRETKGRI